METFDDDDPVVGDTDASAGNKAQAAEGNSTLTTEENHRKPPAESLYSKTNDGRKQ